MKPKKKPGAGDAGLKGFATSSNAAEPNPKIAEGKASPTMLDAVLDYAATFGWKTFPARFEGKKKYSWLAKRNSPSGENWGMTNDPKQLALIFNNSKWKNKCGVGVPTGAVNGIIVVEADTVAGHGVDGLASLKRLEEKHSPLPETLKAESPSGSVHYYFKHPGEGIYIKSRDSKLALGVDHKGDGGMVAAPPSKRADGVYKWINWGTPIAEAPPWLIELIQEEEPRSNGKASPTADLYGPPPDHLKGIGPIGLSDAPRDNFVVDLARLAAAIEAIPNPDWGWDEWNLRVMALFRATDGSDDGLKLAHILSKKSAKYNEQNTNEKWEQLKASPPNRISAASIFYWANEADSSWWKRIEAQGSSIKDASESTIDQGEPSAHKGESKTEKASATIDEGSLLFDPWAPYIVPEFPFDTLPPVLHDFVASQSAVVGGDPSALAMATLAACSGALDHRFSLKMMKHGSWTTHPRLWVLMVGPPSSRRTPLINVACAPLEAYQSTLSREYHESLKEYERAKAAGNKDLEKPAPPPRYVVHDSTIEKLGEILSREAKGLLIKRDEFAGLIGAMEKYGHGRGSALDRAFYLKAYDGGPWSVDRIQRGEIYIENLSISILGGIQPDRLAELHGLASDGFLQRCLPIMMRPGELPKDLPTDDPAYARLVGDLIAAVPNDFYLTDAAREKMNELRAYLHSVEQAAVGLQSGFQSFIGKLQGVAGSLALILYVATNPKFDSMTDRVDLPIIEKVQRIIVNFVIRHAFEFYAHTDSTNSDRQRQIASYVLTSGEKKFTPSDFTRNVASMRNLTLREVNERVSLLVAADWLIPVTPGLDNRHWTLNLNVHKQFADRRRIEEEQKQRIAALMHSPRKPHGP